MNYSSAPEKTFKKSGRFLLYEEDVSGWFTWLGLVLRISFSDLTPLFRWKEGHLAKGPIEIPCQLPPVMFFWNKLRKKTEEEQITQVHLENGR